MGRQSQACKIFPTQSYSLIRQAKREPPRLTDLATITNANDLASPPSRQRCMDHLQPCRKFGCTKDEASSPADSSATPKTKHPALPTTRRHQRRSIQPCRQLGDTKDEASSPADNSAAPKSEHLALPEIRADQKGDFWEFEGTSGETARRPYSMSSDILC
jgi:hypothetical protein